MRDEAKAKLDSLLRRSGLAHVSNSALCCMGAVALVALGFALWRFWPAGASESFQVGQAAVESTSAEDAEGVQSTRADAPGASDASAQAASASDGEADGAQAGDSLLAVDVEGAVVSCGLYHLAAGSRVGDAIEAAGGFAQGAVQSKVNRAQKLEDGMQVYVPSVEEQASGAQQGASAASSSSGSSSGAGASQVSEKVNINTATSEQLQTLQGIGEGMAARIIDYRETKGSFKSIEDIKNVSGIGDARFAAIESSITV